MADLGHGDGRERWRRRSMQLPAHENLGIEAAIARLRAAAPHAKTERMVAPRKRMSARQRRELEHKAAIHTDTRWYNVHKKVAPVFFDEKAQTVAKRLFNMLDADGGGEIDSGEFSDALHFCGATPIEQDVKELVRLGDQDDNGTIDLDEFISMMCNPNTLASMESGALSKSIPPLSLWMLTYNRRKDMEGTTVPMLRKWMGFENFDPRTEVLHCVKPRTGCNDAPRCFSMKLGESIRGECGMVQCTVDNELLFFSSKKASY